MNVRRATLNDAAGIAAIHVHSWQEGYRGILPDDFLQSLSIERRETIWRNILENPTSDTWVAEEEGRLRGWISAGPSRDDDASPQTGELWAIYVDPQAWRSGIGRALWREAEAHLRRAEFQTVTLWVLADNQRALRFYETLGFGAEGGREQMLEIGGAKVREIRLHLNLHGESA